MLTNELKFSDLSRLLEAVSTSKVAKKRDEYMGEYFKKMLESRLEFREKRVEEYRQENKAFDSSCLAVIRIILSQEEKERTYGLQEKSLRNLYIKALKLHKENPDALKIARCSESELPNKIFEVMRLRASETGNLTVYDVDQSLTYLSENQTQEKQEKELSRMISKSTALDQKWICKMILKTMNLQVGTAKVLKLFHPQAHKLFLKYNHLSRVVELVESDQADAAMVELTEVYVPIRSMLCQKFTPDLNKDFLNKDIYQETKMDGERFQLHMKNGVFRYYSRNGHEFSVGFNRLLTPLIQFNSVVHSIILDGEMLVYDKNDERYVTKGETPIDVKHMKDQNSKFRPCFCAFDVLLYNDQNVMNRAYSERNQLLGQLFTDRKGVLVKTTPTKIRSIDHMIELFNVAIDNNEEGVVLKDSLSVYKPGDRAGGWYKVKPDYFDGNVVTEFDCVIIGGFYENLFTKNFIQRYMVGAVEKTDYGTFNAYAIGEVVHGVTVQERKNIFESLKPHLVEHSGESQVSFNGGKIFFGKNKPHSWIPPTLSIVLECRASELIRTNEQYTEYTFRFPRIDKVRRDKIWEDCSTLKDFTDMCATTTNDIGNVKKTVSRLINKTDIISPSRKRKAAHSKTSLIEKFCQNSQELEDLLVIDNVLEGKEFCVMTTNPKLPSVKEMKAMIRQHSGTVTEYPRKGKTFAIIAGLMTNLVKKYMNQEVFNVIKADWLVDNFGSKEDVLKEIPKIRPVIDLYYATEAMKESLKQLYDHHGDSYNEKFESVDQLKAFLENMEQTSCDKDLEELDYELKLNGAIDINYFRNISAVFVTLRDEHFVFDTAMSVLKFRAGAVIELKDASCHPPSCVIVDKDENVRALAEVLANHSVNDYNLVDYRWVLDSNDAGIVLARDDYLVS